jgi:hypothetical protein
MSSYQKVCGSEIDSQNVNSLPAIDPDKSTRHQSILAILFGIISSIACLALGTVLYLLPSPGVTYIVRRHLPYGGTEAITFGVTFVITQCLESLAYVHSISLRWALIRENRLKYNTNIRLLTSSASSTPNKWGSNVVSAACLVLCYASTSQLFFAESAVSKLTDAPLKNNTLPNATTINCVALISLGIALFGQTAIAIWCFYSNLHNIPTWSSNSINTTLTECHLEKVTHNEGRCMRSAVSQRDTSNDPCRPSVRQPSAIKVRPTLRRVLLFVWILAGLAVVWMMVILGIVGVEDGGLYQNEDLELPTSGTLFSWSGCDGCLGQNVGDNTVNFAIAPYWTVILSNNNMPDGLQFILGILFLCAIQLLQATGLHCVEHVVNISRDEDTWRMLDANRKHHRRHIRSVLQQPALLSALTNWKYCILFLSKSGLHWLLGQCINPQTWHSYGFQLGFEMILPRIIVYAIGSIVLASFVTLLLFHRPKGPQPATYGHIQTLANLVDNWELGEHSQFWWGDKGDSTIENGVRHAGMSAKREELEPIRMDELYAGELKLLCRD